MLAWVQDITQPRARTRESPWVDQLLASFLDTAEFLKHMAGTIAPAQTRLIATAFTALDQGVLDDGNRPVRFESFRTTPALVTKL
jgi:hypothetical protein